MFLKIINSSSVNVLAQWKTFKIGAYVNQNLVK